MDVDLVVIGNLLLDDLPGQRSLPGGAALFTALAARCCGLSVAVHSVVGEDYPVHWLEDAGVHLSLTRLPGPGGRTVIRYTPEGRHLEHQGPSHDRLSPQSPHPFRARLVHIAPMPTEIQLFHLRQCAERQALLDPFPGLDPSVWKGIAPWRGRLAALLLNEEELGLDWTELGEEPWLVLKRGPHGGLTRNPELAWRPEPVEVVDPTGAGDAFAAGLAAGILRGVAAKQALALGAEAATWALSGLGASALYQRVTA